MDDQVEKLKELGNGFMRCSQPDFSKAIEAYTEALAINESCHTVLANRSLAFFQLQKYDEALEDAEKAIKVIPNWPKGYVRKCAALNALKRNQEAQQTAQQGFLLMHSTSFCQEFVNQWLKACEEIYSDDNVAKLLPSDATELYQVMLTTSKEKGVRAMPIQGIRAISDVYCIIMFYCTASIFSPKFVPSDDAIKQYFIQIVGEFKRIMSLFGHGFDDSIMTWAELVGEPVDDYQSLMQKKVDAFKATKSFLAFLNTNLHVALFDIARPILVLIIMIMSTQMCTLNDANTGRYSIRHMMFMCLPLFESIVLAGTDSGSHYVNMLIGVINTYNDMPTSLTRDEYSELEIYFEKLKSLIPRFAFEHQRSYEELQGHYYDVIGRAKTAMRSVDMEKTVSLTTQPSYSFDQAEQELERILRKPKELWTISDAENLMDISEVFLDANNEVKAKEALCTGEMLILSLLGVQMQLGILSLSELLPAIRAYTHKLLIMALRLKESKFEKVFCNVIIQWKGLFTEFRVTATRKGLQDTFLPLSAQFEILKAAGITGKQLIEEKIASLKESHQSNIMLFLQHNGLQCWNEVTLFPLLESIESVLLDNELIIEYIYIGKYDEAHAKTSYDMHIFALKPDGTYQLCSATQHDLIAAIKKWIKQWSLVTAMIRNGIHYVKEEQLLDEFGKELSSILFPPPIYECITHSSVKHVYVCPETHFSMIPLQLLPAQNGLPVFHGRSIAYLGSCRELIRSKIVATDNVTPNSKLPSLSVKGTLQGDDDVTVSSAAKSKCYIFANPDFNHCLEMSEYASIWEQLSVLNIFFRVPLCQSLEHSLEEAQSVESTLGLCHPQLDVHVFQGKEANLESVLSFKSPLMIHFSTHGFGPSQLEFDSPNFTQDNSEAGLALAGFNTFMSKNFDCIDPKAASGMLTSLAVSGLNLSNTRLVYLSTCVSGIDTIQGSVNSIANAFRLAGARTVIATTWTINNEASAEFTKHFYKSLCIPGTRPSEALNTACKELSNNAKYPSSRYSTGFFCHGDDIPIFMK